MQEIIVYRNPMEAAIWHGLSNGDVMLNIFCSLIIAIAFAYTTTKVLSLFMSKWQRAEYDVHIAVAALIVWISSMIILPLM